MSDAFDPRILSAEPFVPHEYTTLGNAFPRDAMPEVAYIKLLREYAALNDVEVKRIVYESEGLKVTGLMAYPKDWQKAAHPVALYNRGGNREFGKLTVYNALRMLVPLARMGCIVFASNYRGNDGGEGNEEFGGADVADVMTLLDIAKQHPGYDGRHAYMVGHSRGALMTFLAIRSGAELNAAVGIAGPTDLKLSGEERPELEEKIYGTMIAGTGQAREEAYRSRSAVHWAHELNVPLLLMHGTSDERVGHHHSERLAEALKRAGKEHELVIFEGGNHSLMRHWDEVLKRVDSWLSSYRDMDSFLKTGGA